MEIQRFASFWDELTAIDKQNIEEEKKKITANEITVKVIRLIGRKIH